jgi:type VI secretion system ImpM family protein
MSLLGFGKSALLAYGKLPVAADYLSFGTFRGVGEEWQAWLASAFADAESTSSRGLTSRIYRWWFRGEREGWRRTPLAGFVKDSVDRAGRRFPFSWCTTAEANGRGAEGAIRSALPIWGALGGFLGRLQSVQSAEALYEVFEQAPLAKLLESEKRAEPSLDATVRGLGDALVGGVDRSFAALLGRFQRTFAPQSSGGAPAQFLMKIPISSGYSSDSQALLWARLLDGRPGGSGVDAPNMFLPGERRTADPMVVVFRQLRPEDGKRLFSDDGPRDGVLDLAATLGDEPEPEDVAAGEAVLGRLELDAPASTLTPSAFWPT